MHSLPWGHLPCFAHLSWIATQGRWLPALAEVLLASLWQTAALVLLTAGALRGLPELSAASRSAVWTVVLCVGVITPLVLLPLGDRPASHPALWHAGQPATAVLMAFVALWCAAAAWRCGQLAWSAVQLHTLLRRAEPVEVSPEIAALLARSPRPVSLRLSPAVDRPGVAGFLRPCILLPPGLLLVLSPGELRSVLLHELAHLRRGDDWINLLQQLALALFPLNPALPWLNRRLALERELACDDTVLQATGAPKAYAACLARVAERSRIHRGLTLAIGMLGSWVNRTYGYPAESRPELSRRIERLLAAQPRTLNTTRTRWAIASLCVGLLCGATLLAGGPQLVSFAPVEGTTLALETQPSPFSGNAHSVDLLRVAGGNGSVRAWQPHLVEAVARETSRPEPTVRGGSLPITRRKTSVHPQLPHTLPRVVRAVWHKSPVSPVEQPFSPARTLQAMPVLLRAVPVDFDNPPTWFTAIRVPDGWILVQV